MLGREGEIVKRARNCGILNSKGLRIERLVKRKQPHYCSRVRSTSIQRSAQAVSGPSAEDRTGGRAVGRDQEAVIEVGKVVSGGLRRGRRGGEGVGLGGDGERADSEAMGAVEVERVRFGGRGTGAEEGCWEGLLAEGVSREGFAVASLLLRLVLVLLMVGMGAWGVGFDAFRRQDAGRDGGGGGRRGRIMVGDRARAL